MIVVTIWAKYDFVNEMKNDFTCETNLALVSPLVHLTFNYIIYKYNLFCNIMKQIILQLFKLVKKEIVNEIINMLTLIQPNSFTPFAEQKRIQQTTPVRPLPHKILDLIPETSALIYGFSVIRKCIS